MPETERTCETCKHLSILSGGELWVSRYLPVCRAPLPMWADDGDREVVDEATDATHCAAYAAKEARDE